MSTPTPTVAAGAIPHSLTARDQWVTWKYVPDPKRPEKPKKLPFCAFRVGGKVTPAKSNDLTTWAAFDEALAFAAERHHDGVGFVFSPDDPFCGGDLDGCLDEAGSLKPWAAPIVARLLPVAYVEVSPSGRGLKFITRARIPRALSQKERFGPHEGVELYDWGRYFTITGRAWPGCAGEPGDGQAVLDALYAELSQPPPESPALDPPALPPAPAPVGAGWRQDRARAVDERLGIWVRDCLDWARQEMRQAPEGGKHNRRLQLGKFLGGVIASAPGHLTPEEALAVLYGAQVPAAHHSQELRAIRDGLTTGMGLPLTPGAVGDKDGSNFLPTDADLIVRDGRCYCPTCGERVRRSVYDYGAGLPPGWYCPRCRWPMQWPLSAWDGGEVAQAGPERPREAQAGAGDRPRYRWLRGAEIDQIRMPRWLIRGHMALGAVTVVWGPSESGKTLLLIDIAERVAQHHPVIYVAAEDAAGLRARMRAWEIHHKVARGAIIVQPEALPLSSDAAVDAFIAQALPVAPRLVVLDTLNLCITGLDENSNSEMGAVAARLVRIAERLDCHVAVLHHPTKDGAGMRGASAILNNTSAVWHIERGGDDLITMRQTRNKQGGRRDDRFFRIREIPVDVVDDQGQPLTSVLVLPARKITRVGSMAITKAERDLLRLIADADDAGEPMGTADLMEAVGVSRKQPGSFYRMVKHLKEDCRYIEKGERARSPFTVTAAGRRALEGADLAKEAAAPEPDTPWEIALSLDGPPSPAIAPPTIADALGPEPGRDYAAIEGYDDVPPPDEPPTPAGPWAGDGGSVSEEPEPGPTVAQGVYERLLARKEASSERAAAD